MPKQLRVTSRQSHSRDDHWLSVKSDTAATLTNSVGWALRLTDGLTGKNESSIGQAPKAPRARDSFPKNSTEGEE
jgi:hypothetical protein